MPVKNILVAFDGGEPSQSALELAIRIAQENDGHLTGLLSQPLAVYAAPEAAWIPAEVMDVVTTRAKETANETSRKFSARCAAEGMTQRTSFFAVEGLADVRCSEFARTYDLVVVGQPKGDFWQPMHEPNPDDVAVRSGRPVLVAPHKFRDSALRNGAVLAWDGGRAGARALSEALGTLLTSAGKLTVLYVGEDGSEVRQPGCDVMEHLSRHGIHAELLVVPRANRSISDVVLEMADMSGAGLLVMGAYEHSRFGETLFGGVTRDVLRNAKTPVLIAH